MSHLPSSRTSIWEFLFGNERNANESIITLTESVCAEIIDESKNQNTKFDPKIIAVLKDFVQTDDEPPTSMDLEYLSRTTRLSVTQVRNWIYNDRNRRKKRFSPEQEEIMEELFRVHPKSIKKDLQNELAKEFNVKRCHIKFWFCNRRAKKKSLDPPTVRFVPKIQDILKQEFARSEYLYYDNQIECLMEQTGLTRKQIINWFANRRYRTRSKSTN